MTLHTVKPSGNGAHVTVPKEWVGRPVRVVLADSVVCPTCHGSGEVPSGTKVHEEGCDQSLHLNDGGPDPCRNAEGWRLPRTKKVNE